LGISSERQGVIRTPDGVRYEIETDRTSILGGVSSVRTGEGRGVRAQFDEEVGYVISTVAAAVERGLNPSRADEVTVEFGISIHAEAGFIVSAEAASGTFRVTLSYGPNPGV
jgi:hypothetical protein